MWSVYLSVVHGGDAFNQLRLSRLGTNIMNDLQKWRQDIPDLLKAILEANPKEIKDLPPCIFRKLLDDSAL